ncbi:MAG: PorT family protein [Cryomorphaceae bacterium]|nr:PorT family protein [Cryomorphaceae bacterium]
MNCTGRVVLILTVLLIVQKGACNASVHKLAFNNQIGLLENENYSSQSSADTIADSTELSKPNLFPSIPWSNLPYFMDDIMVIGGLNHGGLIYSNYFRELGNLKGFQIGLEGYYPLAEKVFLNVGLQYRQNGFAHETHDIDFQFHNIDIPILFAFELPVFRRYDWRIFMGTQMNSVLGVNVQGEYANDYDGFRYNADEINKFDFGFTFGLSIERHDFYLRGKGYFGANRVFRSLDPNSQIGETASFSFFQIELGYFLFRRLREF